MALPQQLKSARVAGSDLGNTVPTAMGALESALCDIFGFTVNTNITNSALTLNNSGVITSALVQQTAAGPVGWRMRNSTNGKEMRICVNGANLDFDENTGSEAIPVWVNRFRIAVSTGALTGSTFSTTSAGLAPASDGDPTKFLAADATYAVPTASPVTSCRIYNTTNQNITNGTFTAISFNSESWDSGSMHSGGNPTRITFPTAGKYMLVGNTYFTSGAADTRRILDIQLNGSGISSGRGEAITQTVTQATVTVNALVNASAGDYAELFAWQNSGSTIQTQGSSGAYTPVFSAYKIGG